MKTLSAVNYCCKALHHRYLWGSWPEGVIQKVCLLKTFDFCLLHDDDIAGGPLFGLVFGQFLRFQAYFTCFQAQKKKRCPPTFHTVTGGVHYTFRSMTP